MEATPDPVRSHFPLIIRGPEDLLSAIPYIIGYHPSDDMVIIGLRDRDYAASFRCDLWPPGAPCPITPGLLRSMGIDTALIAAYGTEGDADHAIAHILGILPAARIAPAEILAVTGNRYYDHNTPGTRTRPVPGPTTAIAVGLTAAGYGALPDKTAFARHLDHRPSPFTVSVAAAITRLRRTPIAEIHRWAREVLADTHRLPNADGTAALLLALRDHELAIEAAVPVAPGELTARIPLLTHLLRHSTGRHRTAPAALLAEHAMRAGNGGLARLALQHAAIADPADALV